ncbi:DUF5684 domain-containing protein [Micromonospora yasonensis]|uniref:DUF5684 domain-containing protein n=1 Tax=Micromonospora yasonensis TaxID=1128667 RepID=UPI00222E8704|nr:DUF5684 domain-containing protein [Micromonospora yasonensis]MCW3842483.1 DUF5684 domain-containing protein [Micromonospora yasonensis]
MYLIAAEQQSSAATTGMIVGALVALVLLVVSIAAMWKVFTKAGQPGWAAIIPFYNYYVLVRIAGRPGWWFLLALIPIVNVVISLVVAIDLARSYGRSEVFGVVGLWLFSVIGFLILGFGSSRYQGPAAARA